ncbi:MAG TPA: polysaccharide deacetylase family protein [Candidatus Dormibacteraeota bacterium]
MYRLEHRWVPILMYHRVTAARPLDDPYRNCVPVASFERHLRWLARRGYQTVELDVVARYASGDPHSRLPRKPLVITFDDGYRDNLDLALPVLERFGYRAVVFVVTSTIGSVNSFDPPGSEGPLPMLTAEEIRKLRSRGMAIGSHTHTHPQSLAALDESTLGDELTRSRAILEELLQEPVRSLAYPHSQVDARVESAAAAAGYQSACAGRGTAFRSLRLSRVPAESAGGARLEAACEWRRLMFRVRSLKRPADLAPAVAAGT